MKHGHRAEQESSEPKLRGVGANQIVAPYVIGGHRVAQAVPRPTLGHFIDQAEIQSGSPLCGKIPAIEPTE